MHYVKLVGMLITLYSYVKWKILASPENAIALSNQSLLVVAEQIC